MSRSNSHPLELNIVNFLPKLCSLGNKMENLEMSDAQSN
jgi:hypothetical protein